MKNVEIKARCEPSQAQRIRSILQDTADYRGEDRQRDTYFQVTTGRLKLRQGDIERALIQYDRPDRNGPKTSRYTLVPLTPPQDERTREALANSLGILAVVHKIRHIFYDENVKFHVDFLEGLGHFVEIEVRDQEEAVEVEALREQCEHHMRRFGIGPDALVSVSYSDMILERMSSSLSNRIE